MQKDKVSRFWEKYVEKTKIYHVPANAVRWYVKHVERYIKAHADLRLAQHTTQNINDYLDDLGRTARLSDWQFKQAIKALKILFIDLVRAPWAEVFPWRY